MKTVGVEIRDISYKYFFLIKNRKANVRKHFINILRAYIMCFLVYNFKFNV